MNELIIKRKVYIFNKENILSILAGFIFLAIFYWGYSNINPNFYETRDDGVITMSHAKNLIDYGFIGVGPSGPKVEGYSAPVEFFVYAVLYKLTGIEYHKYAKLQTLVCTFLLGFIFIKFFSGNFLNRLMLTAGVAYFLTTMTSFLQWHASGMENAITHVLFLLTLYILYKLIKNEEN